MPTRHNKRLTALEAAGHAQPQYRPPVLVDVVGLSAEDAAARIAEAETVAPMGVPVRMVVIDCPALRGTYEST